MTLKEKFESTEVFIIKEVCDELLIKRIKIANEFAIGFAEWVQNNCNEFPKEDQELLLRIYKKEKGL